MQIYAPRGLGTVADQCYESASDQELIAGVQHHDEPALGALYDRYHRLVFGIALRITADRASAEEVVQDVFHAVWRSAGRFTSGANLTAWLIGIARHRAIDMVRSRHYQARAREDVLNDGLIRRRGAWSDGHMAGLLQRQVLASALAQIPATQRQAIELAYYSGLTDAEIAAQLQAPVGTIKSRLRIGLLRLRALLHTPES